GKAAGEQWRAPLEQADEMAGSSPRHVCRGGPSPRPGRALDRGALPGAAAPGRHPPLPRSGHLWSAAPDRPRNMVAEAAEPRPLQRDTEPPRHDVPAAPERQPGLAGLLDAPRA